MHGPRAAGDAGPADPRHPAVARPAATPASVPAILDIDDLVAGLHRTHALTLVRLAKLLLRDQQGAEDAFFSLFQALARLSDHDQILPYLRATVINRARSVMQHASGHRVTRCT